jgi:hypothetical protein
MVEIIAMFDIYGVPELVVVPASACQCLPVSASAGLPCRASQHVAGGVLQRASAGNGGRVVRVLVLRNTTATRLREISGTQLLRSPE